MSVKVMSWVWEHSRARGCALLTALAIADSADHDGTNAWPSTSTLAAKTRMNKRSVQRAIAELVQLGELRVDLNAGGSTYTRADRRPNSYTVVMSRGDNVPPGDDRRGGIHDGTGRHSPRSRGGTAPPNPSLKDDPSLIRPAQLDVHIEGAKL